MRRSMLFIPGNSPAMLLNADIHQADAVILDLEDAVSPSEKDAARILVRNAISALKFKGTEIIVRVNPLDSGYTRADLENMVPLNPSLIMPTKVSGADDIRSIAAMMTQIEGANGQEPGAVGLMPLLETAEGVLNAYAIAKADKRVKALFLGAEDLTSDLQAIRSKSSQEIFYARGQIVMAARAAGVDVYDTPFTDVNDDDGMAEDAQFARALGFTGKSAISPRHVSIINEVFSPSLKDIDYAREVMAVIEEAKRLGKGAISLHGKMVDKPIVDRARRVLEAARALGLGGAKHE
ncbi:MAG: aldolase/citrate lyase family protein [Eubacteriales bacterium]|nr:aldolase/citrate lyase family protein [Eubacteriales bacterium]MDD4104933.1 aldolase/citrate lyase family protein [Eubacteriales bacterium]MDD4710087.1 aldolase/citrate lyase family protein [Eubacteriales bacterium]NLO15995.1 HpcH/HpaI aldolase/citrate lyase family protein [Clostridiales bacterium]